MMRRRLVAVGVVLAALVVARVTPLDAGPPAGIDPALLAAARAEGSVTLYGSMTAPQMQALAQRFTQQFGIRVDMLRLESNVLPSRMAIEARAGATHADVVDEPGFQIDLLKRQHLLAHDPAPQNADATAGTYDPDGYWSSLFINTDTLAYNPQLLKSAGLAAPATWYDLTKPEWRGKFALFSGSYEWYAAMVKAFGKDKADGYMRAFAANGVHMVNSHQLAETMLESGEYTAALNTYGYSMANDQARGLATVEVNPNPTVIELHAIAIVAGAPHPIAARLFERWALGRETQAWIAASLGRVSARRDVANNPVIWNPRIHYVISDPAESVNYASYARDFNAIFGVAGG
jgi:ABC-type Fe3+ transport system substrate-binding protein